MPNIEIEKLPAQTFVGQRVSTRGKYLSIKSDMKANVKFRRGKTVTK